MKKRIVMVGTRLDTMGGISSVVAVYHEAGLFDRQAIEYLVSHCDGSKFTKLAVALKAWFRLIQLLLWQRVGLVHVHMSHRASCWRKLSFIWASYIFRVPVLIHLHGSEFADFVELECRMWQRSLIAKTFDRAARIIVLSESWRQWAKGFTSNAAVVTLHNPVSLQTTDSNGSQVARQPNALLFLGRLGHRKGTYDLLDALSKMDQAGDDTLLWLCGDGDVEECRSAVRQLGIEHKVEFLGWVRGDEKQLLLRRAGVYVLPSYREGLPMSVLEAMAAGLPIVSTRIGGIPEAVTDGVEGFLIDAGDIDALKDRLQRLTSAPGQAASMGRAARERVKAEFSAQVIVPRLEAMYAELVPQP